MASNKGNNNTLLDNLGPRLNSFDRVPAIKSPSRLGNGFTTNSTAWDSNANIWANGNKTNAFVDDPTDLKPRNGPPLNSNGDNQDFRGKTGSGSLLPSSESDGWNDRSNFPWSMVTNGSSSGLSRQQAQSLSSVHLRGGKHSVSSADLQSSDHTLAPFPRVRQHGHSSAPDYSLEEPSRHSNSTSQQRNTNSYTLGNSYNHSHGDETRWNVNSAGFRANDLSGSTESTLRFLSPDNDFSSFKSMKLHHNNLSTQSYNNFDLPETQPRSSRASNPLDFGYDLTSHPSHRLSGPQNRSLTVRQDRALQFDGQEDQLLTKIHKIDLQAETNPQERTPRFQSQDSMQRTASKLDSSLEDGYSRAKSHNGYEHLGIAYQLPASSDEAAHIGYPFLTDYRQSISFAGRESTSPAASDYRRGLISPFYSTNSGTPPTGPDSIRSASGNSLSNRASNGQIVTMDRESRGSRSLHVEDPYMLPNTSHTRLQYSQPYSFEGYPGSLRLNPLALPYPLPAYGGLTNAYQPRYPSREHDSSQIVRSALLEEFRANHKTSKRYELKDIYNHFVEFSGDQHGSRFIQQKLETANSDEKDQIFAEIQPNSLQLMTDVFGNYVIQKLFEHGNQAQKKILANQMKNRVMDLSTQMYGCRVVQKALEHILTDQQASMVKELEAHVLKCVKDQNGNHVIQKAIERVPAEHIQFIINAFTGQVNRLAAHPYGCRVIQRMLEHCEESARQSILRELHAGVYPLITDQYGNYVIQHVIEKGHEHDRTRVVAVVTSQLLIFSKHKFASNVVEKSIQCAEAGQRAEILRLLTTPNDKDESPLLGLMRDQYGNYVIQKSLGDFGFKDDEREQLVEHCKPEFMKLKRFSSGKQVMALEKLIFDGDSEPNLSSSQSSTIPSTNTSTVEGPTTLTLPPLQILKTSLVAEPATAIAATL